MASLKARYLSWVWRYRQVQTIIDAADLATKKHRLASMRNEIGLPGDAVPVIADLSGAVSLATQRCAI